MNSGSSEQLLEQHQNEQRRLKLKKLEPKKKNAAKQQPRTVREQVRFYTTATLACLSVSFGASLLFLVPLYVDPAISTLVSDFIEPATWCRTTRREDVVGINNCSWSSCREGCTSDMYKCLHVYVTYVEDLNATAALPANLTVAEMANATAELPQSEEAMLQVNIKGCGYPPSVTCKNFSELYGVEGAVYPCHYSRFNRTLVMTSYNRSNQIAVIVNFFAIPFIVTVISSVALCIMHCDCRFQRERRKGERGRRGQHDCDGHHGDGGHSQCGASEDDDYDEEYEEDGAGGDDGASAADRRHCGGRRFLGGGGSRVGIGMPGTRQRPFLENLRYVNDGYIETAGAMLRSHKRAILSIAV